MSTANNSRRIYTGCRNRPRDITVLYSEKQPHTRSKAREPVIYRSVRKLRSRDRMTIDASKSLLWSSANADGKYSRTKEEFPFEMPCLNEYQRTASYGILLINLLYPDS
ncbi:hypothetical protein T265_00725 [Opisthorchis viverrini]|uniref:Uncharacterized protein n=1 Tax=Opisthorchis viverrini TaxID=6198 RepID=A0A075A224_OPIVI|nr:hypothetical protein T265_00725 [Opisthorchis viverrini]KER33416.1 hypothetical protein T265_00725 [Opisthorchis viverrini]